jgi:hypothetical protein
VLVNDPKELEKIRQRESDITRERIEKILAAGANVVLTTKGIDDMSLKYFVQAGAIAARRVPKDDLRRVATWCMLTSDFNTLSVAVTLLLCLLEFGSASNVLQAHCEGNWRDTGADAGRHGWQRVI